MAGKFVLKIFTFTPTLELICEVLANGLPAHLCSGGKRGFKISFVFVLLYRFCCFHS